VTAMIRGSGDGNHILDQGCVYRHASFFAPFFGDESDRNDAGLSYPTTSTKTRIGARWSSLSVLAERIRGRYPFEVGHLPPHHLLDLFLGRSSFAGSDEHPKPLGRAFPHPVLGVYKPFPSHRMMPTVGVLALKNRRQLLEALVHLLGGYWPPHRAQFLLALALGLESEHPRGRLGPSFANP
jgi:hypothetical protein